MWAIPRNKKKEPQMRIKGINCWSTYTKSFWAINVLRFGFMNGGVVFILLNFGIKIEI